MNTLAILNILANYLPGLEIILYPRMVTMLCNGGSIRIIGASLPAAVQALVERILKDPEERRRPGRGPSDPQAGEEMIWFQAPSRAERRVRTLLQDFAAWLESNYRIDHEIAVCLFDRANLSSTGTTTCSAEFYADEEPEIRLAIRWQKWANVLSWQMARLYLLDSFAHEFVHYQRWRRGDKNWRGHRGLQRQVNAMLNRFESR